MDDRNLTETPPFRRQTPRTAAHTSTLHHFARIVLLAIASRALFHTSFIQRERVLIFAFWRVAK